MKDMYVMGHSSIYCIMHANVKSPLLRVCNKKPTLPTDESKCVIAATRKAVRDAIFGTS